MPPILKTSKIFGVPNASVWAQGILCNMLLHAALPLCLGCFLCPVSSIHSLGLAPESWIWTLLFDLS